MEDWVLPQRTQLGDLSLVDTLLYYDMPLMFTCVNSQEDQFIGLALDFQQDFGEWLFLPLSAEKLDQLYSHAQDLRSAICASEGVWKARRFANGVWVAHAIEVSSLHDNILPDEGLYLDKPVDAVK